MRQGQQNRRGRGRSNNGSSNNGSNNNSNNNTNNNGRKPQNALSRNYESSGPDVKIRGTAAQIAEKYMTLARDASSAGDIVMAENYLQHAEHYNRIIMAAQVQAVTQNPNGGEHIGGMNGHHHRMQSADGINSYGMRDQPQPQSMRDQPQPVIEQPQAQSQPPQLQPQPQQALPGLEPQPEVVTPPQPAMAAPSTPPAPAASAPGDAADATDPAQPRAPEADGRRRRRRYPVGGAAASRAAAAAEPTANGHSANGNGLDSDGGPSDKVLPN